MWAQREEQGSASYTPSLHDIKSQRELTTIHIFNNQLSPWSIIIFILDHASIQSRLKVGI